MSGVIVTGFMGTGKTTVGRILADRYGLPFLDTDDEIERRAAQRIDEIFETIGEQGFRRLEREVLMDLPRDSIVATGGGALVTEADRALLDDDRPILCLRCDPSELAHRLHSSHCRPLLAEWPRLLRDRAAAYAVFEQVDTTGRSPEKVAEVIACRAGLDRAAHLDFPGGRESDIRFERHVLERTAGLLDDLNPSSVLIVTDENIAALGPASRVVDSLRAGGRAVGVEMLPAGEETKSLACLDRLYGVCREAGLDRAGVVIGLGGGVIGDLAGLLAATYMRGLKLVLIPTTLLAQVDASIGGKVGIDAHGTKNLVGAFHPASHVLIDPNVLGTVPLERLSEGLAEVVKIAAVRSSELLTWLERLRGPRDILCHPQIARRAVVEKVTVVADDPFEQGERALLNFGHTVGHALEQASGYRVSHGAAVAAGMLAEARLGERLGVTLPETTDRIEALVRRFDLPTAIPGLDPTFAFDVMLGDKKRERGELRFAIPRRVGSGEVISVSDKDARGALEEAIGGAR